VALAHRFELPLLSCHAIDSMDQLSTQEKQQYAVSIGLACSNFSAEANAINFRKEEFAYPHPWKRMKRPLLSYFALIALLSTAFYFYGQAFLRSQENEIKHNYLSLLASMNKSYEDFETFFTKKTGNYISAEDLKKEDIFNRLESLQKDLKATPDSFPLFPNTPRLSDVLGWLNQHPNINHKKEDGSIESRLKVEKLIYTMVKRPIQGKKQERYQVKVELDLSSPVATWAREFHDALITPNDFVDPKGEIKWNTNKGLYQTSFYLKDKTYYFGQ
jgi:type IV pilus assembly protein PilM